MIRSYRLVLAQLVVAVVLAVLMSGVRADPLTLRFGVVPQEDLAELAERWGPLLHRLSVQAGVRLELRSANDNALYERALTERRYDLAYLNPEQYARVARGRGYEAFARDDQSLVGILVVRKDSPVRRLADLQGNVIAVPSREAYAARILVTGELRRHRISVQEEFVGHHMAVYRHVVAGRSMAGGGVKRTFLLADPTVRDELRILWSSAPVPSHPFVIHRSVDGAVRERLRTAFSGLNNDPEGRTLLQSLGFSRLISASDREYVGASQTLLPRQ